MCISYFHPNFRMFHFKSPFKACCTYKYNFYWIYKILKAKFPLNRIFNLEKWWEPLVPIISNFMSVYSIPSTKAFSKIFLIGPIILWLDPYIIYLVLFGPVSDEESIGKLVYEFWKLAGGGCRSYSDLDNWVIDFSDWYKWDFSIWRTLWRPWRKIEIICRAKGRVPSLVKTKPIHYKSDYVRWACRFRIHKVTINY